MAVTNDIESSSLTAYQATYQRAAIYNSCAANTTATTPAAWSARNELACNSPMQPLGCTGWRCGPQQQRLHHIEAFPGFLCLRVPCACDGGPRSGCRAVVSAAVPCGLEGSVAPLHSAACMRLPPCMPCTAGSAPGQLWPQAPSTSFRLASQHMTVTLPAARGSLRFGFLFRKQFHSLRLELHWAGAGFTEEALWQSCNACESSHQSRIVVDGHLQPHTCFQEQTVSSRAIVST
jgi:hypothetical protein